MVLETSPYTQILGSEELPQGRGCEDESGGTGLGSHREGRSEKEGKT